MICVGYMQTLCHCVKGTWASTDFGIFEGSWNQSPVDAEGQCRSTEQNKEPRNRPT